jgi:uncharacterized protein YjeT (DUF2065 family)
VTNSKQLAGLIGPTMIALGVTEAGNMEMFSSQISPVVYLNGAILFVAGLAIVRAHNLWTWRWPVILTLVGWVALFAGLWRMAAPNAPQAPDNILTYAGLAAVVAIGAILSVIAYGPKVFSKPKPTDV